jgi:hypothetical protein
MRTYRNIPYEYKEWVTFSGKPASGFNCNDKNLLQHVNTISFGTTTEEEMRLRIDDYLDNVEHYRYMTKLHHQGAAAYYAEKRASGDNYTGD